MTGDLSTICRANTGRPNSEHVPCTGCDCTCHAVRPPKGFRDLVEHYKTSAAVSPGEGATVAEPDGPVILPGQEPLWGES